MQTMWPPMGGLYFRKLNITQIMQSLSFSHKLPPGQYCSDGVEYLFDVCPGCFKEKHFYFNTYSKKGECKVCGLCLFGLDALEGVDGNCWRPQIITARKRTVPPESINAWFHPPAREYLIANGVSAQQCLALPIVYEPEHERITCPIDPLSDAYGASTLVRWFTYTDSKWYSRQGCKKLRYVFNKRVLARKRILIMEGIFDVLASDMLDYAIATLGTQVRKDPKESLLSLLRLSGVECWVWFDWDDAGRKGTKDLMALCENWGIACHDLTSVIQREPKSLCPRLHEGTSDVLEEIRRGLGE